MGIAQGAIGNFRININSVPSPMYILFQDCHLHFECQIYNHWHHVEMRLP